MIYWPIKICQQVTKYLLSWNPLAVSTESTQVAQTLQKTVVFLDIYLSLPEANPFMVYLDKTESRGRKTPDPRGFIFPPFGVLLERDISCLCPEFL